MELKTDNGIVFRELSKKETVEAQKLRYDVYCVQKSWEPKNYLGLETDEFDGYAYHFGGFYKDELILYARLIDGNKTELPIKKFNSGAEIESKNSLEISRLILKKDSHLSFSKRQIVVGILYLMLMFVLERGWKRIYALVREPHLRALRIFYVGVCSFRKINDPFLYSGVIYHPIEISVSKIDNFLNIFNS